MLNLRTLTNADLKKTLEGDFSLPVFLTDPAGVKYETTNDNRPLSGQVLYDRVKVNPDTGEELVVKEPIVTLRRASLTRIPAPGERWQVQIPETPDPEAAKKTFLIGTVRGAEGGAAIGFIRLYLQEAEQS